MNKEQENKPIDLGNRLKGEIVLPPIDILPFVGKKAAIIVCDTYEGKFGVFVKAETDFVDEKKRIRASKIWNLNEDAEGNLGWSAESKLGLLVTPTGSHILGDVDTKLGLSKIASLREDEST